jgi:hypothetical protein
MSSEPSPVVVSDKTAFSWPVVVVLCASLLAVGGGMARVEGLRNDLDLLRARVDLLEHQQSADRGQLNAQGATLTEMKAILVELRTDVREALRGGFKPAAYK